MVRRKGKRPTNTIWIFCEGEKTEKSYFNKLKVRMRLSRFRIKVNESTKKDAVGIVNYALGFKKANPQEFHEKDIIYCVFDRNGNKNKQLDKAGKIAQENGLGIIYSNPCFEYWILSHFEYSLARCDANDLIARIGDRYIDGYRKNDPDIYDKTEKHIDNAIANTTNGRNKHESKNIAILSEESNPCTQVSLLIEKFRELKKEDGRI